MSSMQITVATPPLNCTRELYFAVLIFVVCQLTVKTAKIRPLENFPLYGIHVHIYTNNTKPPATAVNSHFNH